MRWGERWTAEEVERAHRLHLSGKTYAEVAAELGRTRKAVAVRLSMAGKPGRLGRPTGRAA